MNAPVWQMPLPIFCTRIFRALLAMVLLCCSLAGTRALADDRAAVRLFAQDFYAAYAAAKDPDKFIAKSDKITPAFKKTYAALMKTQPDYDPIIQGQDAPSSGFKAGEVKMTDTTHATVTLIPRDKGFANLKVHVLWNGKAWLFNGVNDFRGNGK
jgi:hypothetical protein